MGAGLQQVQKAGGAGEVVLTVKSETGCSAFSGIILCFANCVGLLKLLHINVDVC
jgi:hypothetical protein